MNSNPAPPLPHGVNLKATLLAMERTLIHSALIACDWNQRKAAAALGVRPTTLSQKMQRLKLRPQSGATRARVALADQLQVVIPAGLQTS